LRRYIDGLRSPYLSEQVLNNSLLHQAVKTALLRVDHFLFFMATNFVVTQKTRIPCASRLIDESLRARLRESSLEIAAWTFNTFGALPNKRVL